MWEQIERVPRDMNCWFKQKYGMGAPAEPKIGRKMKYVGRVLHLCMPVAASFITPTKSLQFESFASKTGASCSLALNRSPFTSRY